MAGSIVIDLLMRTGSFETDTKRAERRLKAFKKEAAQVGRAIGFALAGAGAGIAAMVASSVNAAREIKNLSAIANTSAGEFQRFAFGADMVGISQEKLADILKDMSDRVGDFITTGAGPMADFFEQIAPRVGVTAEQFRNLSGRDGLLLFVDSLEKANLSQSEMIFFMEAMASDSSALLPLLRDNGEEMGRLGDQADRLGKVLSDVEIDQLEEVKTATDALGAAWSGASNTLVAELIPTINTATGALVEFSDDGEFAAETAGRIATAVKSLAAVAIGAAAAVELIGKSIGGLTAAANAAIEGTTWYEALFPPLLARRIASNFDEVQSVADSATDDLAETSRRYATLLDKLWNPEPPAERGVLEGMFADLELPQIASLSGGRREGGGDDKVKSVLPSRNDFDTSWIEELEEGFGAAAGYVANTRTEVERLEGRIAEVRELSAEGFFAAGTDAEVLARLEADLAAAREREAEAAKGDIGELTEFATQASRNAQDILAQNLKDGFAGGARGIMDQFTNMISDLVAEAIAADLGKRLFGEEGVGSGGGWVGAAAKFAGSFFGGGRAKGGGVNAGVTYGINELEPEYFTPSTSGMVVPLSKMGGRGGGVSVTQNISVSGRVDQRTASQLAIEASRRQRVASARLG